MMTMTMMMMIRPQKPVNTCRRSLGCAGHDGGMAGRHFDMCTRVYSPPIEAGVCPPLWDVRVEG
eukprot:3970539-Karenia_brevis.AAC.1